MTSRIRSVVLAILLIGSSSPAAFAGCDALCMQQGTQWEHCSDTVLGEGDLTDCSDVNQCMICVDYYSGEPYVCCLQTCKGHVCLIA
jgi:hypothetical protein